MKRPQVEIKEIRLLCPDCGNVLEFDICECCGCQIDTEEFEIDIQPIEILEKR